MKAENILGTRLKKLRGEKGFSQKEFGAIFGLTNFQISRYEKGTANPDPDLITKFADYFEVTTDYLLGRVDERDSYISIAFEDGGKEPLSEDEKEHLEEMLKNFRETKKRWLKARGLTEDDL
ncbi:helix-turn-helix domain-containing protein [Alkalicoccobacillus porphyridii]|uniref:Helix-turn-helix transcriptional regulator n=1 Tax=Alkalicoccobacillus porphyridii TaxID=2597270 RepID=A0A554A0G4_9BACI|nr:helix-turn-helix transcriptional regulator [Alkalicoccobacillus porphyridii]TSB47153.1 helix-turn-helix transcriptional regulator [Alkalicoccobacillus porphyridii]